jgi:hypothetical protein
LFVATVELWTAARSDPDLRAQLGQVEPLVTGALTEFMNSRFADLAASPEFRHWRYTAMDVIRGSSASKPRATLVSLLCRLRGRR